jgi:hypothetical protein
LASRLAVDPSTSGRQVETSRGSAGVDTGPQQSPRRSLKTTVEELTQARADADARVLDLSQRLRNVRKSKAQETARSISAALPPFVIVAALATLGFWTYQLIWSAPPPLLAVTSESMPEAEQQRLAAIKEAGQLQSKAADAEAKLQAAEAEQLRLKEDVQRQSTLAADADSKRKAAEAEQQRLKEEVQRRTKLAADTDAKRQAAEAEQQRLKEEVQGQTKLATDTETKRLAAEERLTARLKFEQGRVDAEAATKKPEFTIRTNTEASGPYAYTRSAVASRAACEEICTRDQSCKIFTYEKINGICYRFRDVLLVFNSNDKYDSGVRIQQTK